MYVLIENNEITKYFNHPKGFTLGENQYSADLFMKWSVAEKEAIGIYEVVFDDSNKKDEKWYINTNQSFAFADGVVTASYGAAIPKAHADTLWTQQDSDDGDLPDDKEVGDVKTEGLKTTLIKTLKSQVAGILNDTDWYITRNSEKSTAIPSAISTHRDAVRTKQASMETAITNAADTAALETLYTYVNTGTESNPVIARPLGELPVLES
jgi:hypothetical protein